jgi:dinuclear metal center YbgI/SA1388 family protein
MPNGSIPLDRLVSYCDQRLQPERFTDYDRAVNGLQVANRGSVRRIAACVDATLATVNLAAEAGADLMIVHHGLFWAKTTPWTGRRYELIRRLIDSNIAIYSQHLPLDGHPQLGNAAQLAKALGLARCKPFFAHKGATLGVKGTLPRAISRDQLAAKLSKAVGGKTTLLPGGEPQCRVIGICTGGAGAELELAAREGVDTFITGEGPHWTFALAEETGINVLYGGHYATETFGVKALAAELSTKFRVPWVFLDRPSGL